jgi:hypothetical protein
MVCFAIIMASCTQDTQQKLARKKMEYLDGDYNVTYTDQGIIKTWEVRDGKITSVAEKGYYFFWAQNDRDKEFYVQAPINRVFIEEAKD